MQLGFALLETGKVRRKNANSTLMKNLFDAYLGAISFWLVGYGCAFGNSKSSNNIIGINGGMYASSGFET